MATCDILTYESLHTFGIKSEGGAQILESMSDEFYNISHASIRRLKSLPLGPNLWEGIMKSPTTPSCQRHYGFDIDT